MNHHTADVNQNGFAVIPDLLDREAVASTTGS
jgi:hypothetical protein